MAQIFKAKTLVSSTGRFSHEATAPNLVYNTGDQTISGNKTFNNDVVFTGTAIFNEIDLSDTDSILLSGIDIQIVSGSMTLTNSPTISGNPFITGNLALYATTINLATTGSTLDTKINNLSGYINSTGSNIVFTTGNQNIGGNKTFTGVTTFSGQQVNLIDTALNLSGVGDMTFEGTNINFINSPVFISGTNLRVVGDVIANNLVYKTGNQTVSGNKTFIGTTILSGSNAGGFIGESITLVGGNGAGIGGGINLIGGIGSSIVDGFVTVNANISVNRGTNKNISTAFYKSGDSGIPYLNITKDQINITNGATLLVSGVAVTPALYATSANLASTGSTLDTRINNLSGYINSSSSNIVFTTGNQIISGVKTFAQDATFGDTGQGDFLVISGNNFTVYGSGNFTSGLFVNSSPVLTGSSTLYATSVNLASTGSNLNTQIENTKKLAIAYAIAL